MRHYNDAQISARRSQQPQILAPYGPYTAPPRPPPPPPPSATQSINYFQFQEFRPSQPPPSMDAAAHGHSAAALDARPPVGHSALPPQLSPPLPHGAMTATMPFPDPRFGTASSYPSTTSDHGAAYDSIQRYANSAKSRRMYCCCFTNRRSCCGFWIAFTFLLLVSSAAAVFFLFPRYPTLYVSKPYPQPGKSDIQVSYGQPTPMGIITGLVNASPSNPYSFGVPLAVDMTVFSPNYISVGIDSVVFNSNLLDDAGNVIPTVTANGDLGHTVITAKANTTATIPFQITFTARGPINISKDPVIALLVDRCSANQPLQLKYKIELTLTAIAWTGYHPQTSGVMSIKCPDAFTAILPQAAASA